MSAISSPVSASPVFPKKVFASFMTTLEAGQIYEDFTVFIINRDNIYTTIIRPEGNFPDYDAYFSRLTKTGKKFLTTETKLDGLALKTLNMCVEFETLSKPMNSGINATKSIIWIHVLHNYDMFSTTVEYIRIPTAKLREYIAENKPKDKWGGNNYGSHFYLIPLSEMAEFRYSVPISSLPVELVERIRKIPSFLVNK